MADQLGAVSVYFRHLLALGGALIVALLIFCIYFTILSLSDVASVPSRFGVRCQMVALVIVGLVCCAPFVLLTALFIVVQAKTKTLPPWIDAQSGEVGRLCFGALGCAVFMALLTVLAPVIMHLSDTFDNDGTDVKSQHGRSAAIETLEAQ